MKIHLLLGLALIFICRGYPVFSQDAAKDTVEDSLHYQWERFSLNLGFFLTGINSGLSINGKETGLGVNLNLEEALGLNTSSFVVRSEASYNFGSRLRSHIRMGYFGLIRNSSKTLEKDIPIGDTIYPIGTYVNCRYDIHIIRALYDYDYFKDERISLGVSGGFYVLPVRVSIGTQNVIDENAEFIAPLPVVGIRNMVYITPRILLKQSLELLYLKTSTFQGSISDMNVYLEYNPFTHFGLGAGFNTFNFRFSMRKELKSYGEFTGSVSTEFSGFMLYAKYFF